MQSDSEDRWLRLSVVAARLGCSTETARQLILGRYLKGRQRRPRGAWEVRESECERYLAEIETGTAAPQPAPVVAAA